MTTKVNFSAAEWKQLLNAPHWIYRTLAVSEKAGLITVHREIAALNTTLKEYKTASPLVKALLADQKDADETLKGSLEDAEKALSAVGALLDSKAGDDADDMRKFLNEVGHAIANAVREEGGRQASAVSDTEAKLLANVEKWIGADIASTQRRQAAATAAAQTKALAEAKAKAEAEAKAKAEADAKALAEAKAKAAQSAAAEAEKARQKAEADARAAAQQAAEKAAAAKLQAEKLAAEESARLEAVRKAAQERKEAAEAQARQEAEKEKQSLMAKAQAAAASAAASVTESAQQVTQSAQNVVAQAAETVQQAVQPEPVKKRTYVVKAGDTLSHISLHFYGSANRYMEIFEANRDKLKTPSIIIPGQELIIP